MPDSPERAAALASEALRRARAEADPEAAIVAQRALGLVAVETGDVRSAATTLRRAVRGGERADLRERAAEARMTLALALAYGGDAGGALGELDRARGVLRGVAAARLEMQRAVVLQKLDRPAEALAGYRRALAGFRRHGDRLWEARLLSNRGILHGERGAYAAARADLERAERLHREDGRTLAVAQMRQNLGWLDARIGNVPAAFAQYDAAEQRFREAGAITGLVRLDRGELLMRVGLLGDARRELELAVDELGRGGMEADLAEARVMLAELALLDGDPDAAADAARKAERAFASHARARWRILARLALLRAAAARGGDSGDPRAADPGGDPADLRRRASALAVELDAAGWTSAAVDARLIAARAAIALGRPAVARSELRRARRATRTAPLAVRAAAWHAEALLRVHEGDGRGAALAVSAGLRAVEAHRATLGATELRVHAARHGVPLAQLGIRLALDTRRARRVLHAAEQARAAALRFPPLQPPRDAPLAAALAELRHTVAAVEETILAGGDARPLVARQAGLERDIRARARHATGGVTADPPRLDDLAAVLGDRVLVELVTHDRQIHAVELADGRARLRHVGPADEIEDAQQHLAFALRRRAFGLDRRELAEEAARVAARLDAWLLGSLDPDRELVVVPTGGLHALAWAALPSCKGRPVSVAPSAALWLRAARTPVPAKLDRCAFIAGPGLALAEIEVRELAASYPEAIALAGPDSTVDHVLDAIAASPQAHIAAHGTFRADNPLFSSLQLHDGALTVVDLEGLASPPLRMILTACDAGRSAVAPGDELRGLVAALLSLGTVTVVASVLPVPDEDALAVARELHRELRAGASPATALARAVASAPATGFTCFGAG